jgi:hypothetical protein
VALGLAAWGCSRQEPPGATASSASASPSGAPASSVEDVAIAPLALASAESHGAAQDDEELPEDAGAPADAGAPSDVPSGPDYDPVEGGEHKLAAIAGQAWVYSGPNDETPKLGYLRAGAVVDRGEKPVAVTKRCKRGWYRIAPRGFVCHGRRATIDPAHPVVVASWKRPARGEPLPYRYAKSKEVAPHLYFKVPSVKEQERAESIKLSEYVAGHPREHLLPLAGTLDPLPPFLEGGKPLPKAFGVTQRLRVGAHEGRANPKSAFAFLSVHDVDGRLFGLSTDLNLIPLDRVNLVRATDIHGGEIADLPAGLVSSHEAPRYRIDDKGIPHHDGKLAKWTAVSLTGENKGDLWETRDGFWVSAQLLKMVKKRDAWPSFVRPEAPKKWIDVSVHQQMLIAYEGQRAVYLAMVSTGIGDMGDPEKTLATKRGTFTIKAKHLTALMTGEQVGDDYELADVPYVQYFEAGYALHAAFWHEKFGRPWSHGCVNLPPQDAAWLFEWSDPQVPKEWHGAQAEGGNGTVVNVRY